jgi:hypothetical protein
MKTLDEPAASSRDERLPSREAGGRAWLAAER